MDDIKLNLALAKNALKDHYKVSTVMSGLEALNFVKEHTVDLILMDIEMPGINGIETLTQMKQDDMISNIPVIFLTALANPDIEAKCLTLGAQDFITKPFFQPAMLQRVQRVLELQALRADLEQQVMQKTQDLEFLTIQTITTFANAIDAKDPYTKGHSYRVAQYSKLIAAKLGWSDLAIKNLFYTALLHDIGKIGIPDYILTKTTSLTDEENAAIRKHPEIGCHILKDVILVPYLSIGAYSHHERMDGTGYPMGTKGENIPLIGRIISVADAVDAMMSDRAYRKKLPISTVIHELQANSGTQFDPTLASIMAAILETGVNFTQEEPPTTLQNILLAKIVNEYVNFSNVDGLTGLWNRIYLEEKMENYLQDSEAASAFFMIDLDNFKQVNDVWGHTAGDSLLASFSVTIQACLPPGAIACRMGGDEFSIFIPGYTSQEAIEFARLLFAKARHGIKEKNSPFQVTLSAGIALSPEDGKDYQELYHNADKALYHAKRTGKNAFSLYKSTLGAPPSIEDAQSVVNLDGLLDILSEKTPKKGAYLVKPTEFKKIYQLLQRMSNRTNEKLQIILFTFSGKNNEALSEIDLMEKTKNLILAAKESLRIGDVATKFGSSQYIILLKNARYEVADHVANRILQHFHKIDHDDTIDLNYEMSEIKE